VAENRRSNLTNLIGLGFASLPLNIDPRFHVSVSKDVMAASCSFFEAQVQQQAAEVGETDVGVGAALEDSA